MSFPINKPIGTDTISTDRPIVIMAIVLICATAIPNNIKSMPAIAPPAIISILALSEDALIKYSNFAISKAFVLLPS